MTDLGDFPLDRPPDGPPSPRRQRAGLLAAVGLVLVGAVVIAYLLIGRQGEDVAVAPLPAVAESPRPEAVSPAPVPLEETPVEIVLPALDESDSLVRDLVRALSSHPQLAAWLVTDGLIRTFTVTVDNIADGRNPAEHIAFLTPTQRFLTTDQAEEIRVDPRSYDRYNRHADVVGSLDAEGTARLYKTLEPLITDAYRDLGHPEGGFDETLERAIQQLLDTPVIEREVAVIPRLVYYEFADPTLEALSPVQKQFLGMGPRNVRVIQEKLRELASALGIPEDRLPSPVVFRAVERR